MQTLENATSKRYVVLHDIRSAYNVGSMFRTADGAGVTKVFLCGVTPAPIDRFGRVRKDIAKVALGAEASVPWEQVSDTAALIARLKSEGAQVVAVEQSPRAVAYGDFKPNYPAAFIFGNELDGVPEEVLNSADAIVEIPMHGAKESLNVAVSAGIILFHFV